MRGRKRNGMFVAIASVQKVLSNPNYFRKLFYGPSSLNTYQNSGCPFDDEGSAVRPFLTLKRRNTPCFQIRITAIPLQPSA